MRCNLRCPNLRRVLLHKKTSFHEGERKPYAVIGFIIFLTTGVSLIVAGLILTCLAYVPCTTSCSPVDDPKAALGPVCLIIGIVVTTLSSVACKSLDAERGSRKLTIQSLRNRILLTGGPTWMRDQYKNMVKN